MKDKKTVRALHKKTRDEMTPQIIRALSEKICDHVTESEEFLNADRICMYYPLGSEVDVRYIAEKAWEQGKRTAFPVTEGDLMEFREASSFDDFAEGNFHVMEPVTGNIVSWEDSLMIVPGLAFTEDGYRTGYGGGYYDRYLVAHPGCMTVGVCYENQIEEKLPTDEFDIKLCHVVTENGMKR